MNKKKLWIIGVVIIIAVALLLVLLFIGRQEQPAGEQEAVLQEITVETPYGTLYYPGEWQDRVYAEVVQGETVTVSFYGLTSTDQEVRLFDVIFGDSEGEILGTVKLDSGETCPVGVYVYEAAAQNLSAEKDLYEYNAMQEEINYLIARLPIENAEQYSVPKESNMVVQNQRPAVYADVVLETPYATVAYPGELAGQLHVEVHDEANYPVTFCWNRGDTLIRLFEIAFGGEEGELMGYLVDSGKPVRVTVFDIAQEADLNQEELDAALSLQEVLNDVLDRLPMQVELAEEISYNTYETAYGMLCYPDEYQQYLDVEISGTEIYTVSFRFLRENAAAIPLFDVIFNGTEGVPVGQYTGEDGVSVPVNLVSHSIPGDALLSEEEQNLYYSMAEGANFLFEKYEEMYAFEFQ